MLPNFEYCCETFESFKIFQEIPVFLVLSKVLINSFKKQNLDYFLEVPQNITKILIILLNIRVFHEISKVSSS